MLTSRDLAGVAGAEEGSVVVTESCWMWPLACWMLTSRVVDADTGVCVCVCVCV